MIDILIISTILICFGIAGLFGYIKIPRQYSVHSWTVNYKRTCALGNLILGVPVLAIKIVSLIIDIPSVYIILSIIVILIIYFIYSTVTGIKYKNMLSEATKNNSAYSA